jgi:hypothetical protein
LHAILARYSGDWDNEHLAPFGKLLSNPADDVKRIARAGIDAEQPNHSVVRVDGGTGSFWLARTGHRDNGKEGFTWSGREDDAYPFPSPIEAQATLNRLYPDGGIAARRRYKIQPLVEKLATQPAAEPVLTEEQEKAAAFGRILRQHADRFAELVDRQPDEWAADGTDILELAIQAQLLEERANKLLGGPPRKYARAENW